MTRRPCEQDSRHIATHRVTRRYPHLGRPDGVVTREVCAQCARRWADLGPSVLKIVITVEPLS